MNVFISWSGDQSQRIAEVLSEWLPKANNLVKPFYSPDDIMKGTRWQNEIARQLESTALGIFCLTPANVEAPWLLFEAGALSRSVDNSRVCPILFGFETTELTGPLVQFNHAKFSYEEMRRVMQMLNAQLDDAALSSKTFESVFEKWWPELDAKVKQAIEKAPAGGDRKQRSQRELLEEVLTLVRGLARDVVPDESVRAVIVSYEKVVEAAVQGDRRALLDALSAMSTPLSLLPRRRSWLFELFGGRNLPLMRALERLKALDTLPAAASTISEGAGDSVTPPNEALRPTSRTRRRASKRKQGRVARG
jgi:hypothetical protein